MKIMCLTSLRGTQEVMWSRGPVHACFSLLTFPKPQEHPMLCLVYVKSSWFAPMWSSQRRWQRNNPRSLTCTGVPLCVVTVASKCFHDVSQLSHFWYGTSRKCSYLDTSANSHLIGCRWDNLHSIFKEIFAINWYILTILFHAHGYFACICICAPLACLVPMEARSGSLIP